MRIANLIIIFFIFTNICFSFPLKNIKKGDVFDFSKFASQESNFANSLKDKKLKMVLLWRSDKQLSVKIAKNFKKICSTKDIYCYSVDIKQIKKDELHKLIGDLSENFYITLYNGDIIEDLGIYTLPVTIFLDKNNKVIDAIGYEGQYYVKISKYLDYLTGKISKDEYEKYSNTSVVDRRRSILPDINFIKRLIRDGQKDDAIKRLSSLKLDNLTNFEKVKLSEVYILLQRYKDAVKLLEPISDNFTDAKFYLSLAYYNIGEYDKALNLLKSIENIYPNKERIYFLLGKIFKSKGDFKKGCEYFEKSCEQNLID